MKKMLGILLLMVLLAGCSIPESADTDIRIGGLFGLTGFASFAGESSRDGFLMAIEDSGLEVDYAIEDHASDMTSVATAARKLIDADGVRVIIGPEWEFGAIVSPFAEQGDALFISPWLVIDPEWTEPELFMSGMPRETVYSQALAEHMVLRRIGSVALLRTQDDFALTVEREIRKALAGEDISLEVIPIDVSSGSFKTELLKAVRTDPDAIYMVVQTDAAQATMLREARELGIERSLYIHHARGESDVFLSSAGDAANGVHYISPKDFERMDEFREKFRTRFGHDPVPSAAVSYDMTTLALEAMAQGARTPEEIQAYVLSHEGRKGYSGLLEFDDGFLASGATKVVRFEDGQRVTVD